MNKSLIEDARDLEDVDQNSSEEAKKDDEHEEEPGTLSNEDSNVASQPEENALNDEEKEQTYYPKQPNAQSMWKPQSSHPLDNLVSPL